MLLTIVVVVLVLLAVVLGLAATKPDSFRTARSTSIDAPPEKILPLIADFHSWAAWSPWEKLDPALRRTHSGAPSGTGAVYEWEGNKQVGKGRMEITDVAPPSRITIKLDFFAPFEAHNTAEFTLAPKGPATDVTWAMTGTKPFFMKLMGIFMDMDELVGKDFQTGLANLKALAEK
jgi:uncharacterized protein YndB with AHSA1/START domain